MILRGEEFEVIGILQPTLSAPDTFAFVAYEDALALFYKANPFIKQAEPIASVDLRHLGRQGTDPEALSKDIESAVPGVRVISPARGRKADIAVQPDIQRDPVRHRLHRAGGRRTFDHQHHGDVGLRAHTGDRPEEGHRRRYRYDPRRVPARIGDDRLHGRAHRDGPGGARYLAAEQRDESSNVTVFTVSWSSSARSSSQPSSVRWPAYSRLSGPPGSSRSNH